jgi:shikimate kinase
MAIEKIKHVSHADIFRSAFRERFLKEQQNSMIKLCKLKQPAIIATGAEVALMPECAELMQKMGTVIHNTTIYLL